MAKPLSNILDWIAKNFSNDLSKMIIWSGVAGWTLSSLAQIAALIFNPKLSKEEKSFLVPQECADAAVNIGAFFLVTQLAKKTVTKLFTTGKFAPKSVRTFLNKNKETIGKNIGKLDFNLDEVKDLFLGFPVMEYERCRDFGTTLATVGAAILSSNIITPIMRNNMAASMQKNYLKNQQKKEIEKPQIKKVPQPVVFKSYSYSSDMRI